MPNVVMIVSLAPALPRVPKLAWRQRVLAPVRALLVQGTSPDQLAMTLSVGTVCSLVPLLGCTSLFNLIVGLCLRLNQPILQAWNQVLGPLQLALILVYVRLGEKIFHATPVSFSLPVLLRAFKDDPRFFFVRFGSTVMHAMAAWAITAPILIGIFYYTLRPLMRRFVRKQERSTP